MTNYNPFKYKSLIQRTIDKNRAIHSQIVTPDFLILKQKKYELFEYITALPVELKRLIFKFIDIDTRLNMLLEKRPYLLTGANRPEFDGGLGLYDTNNPMASLLKSKDLLNIYNKGFLNPLYKYNTRTRKWTRTNDFDNPKLFSKASIYCNKISDLSNGLRLNPSKTTFIHCVHGEFSSFRRSIQYNKTGFLNRNGITWQTQHMVPVLALSLLLNTDAYNTEINYYLRKKAFNFIYELSLVLDPKIEAKKVKDKKKLQNQEMIKEITERSNMASEDLISRKAHKKYLNEIKMTQIIYKRNFAAAKIRFKPTLLLLKKRNKIIAKQASIQAKEQTKQAKIQAKEQAKIAKIQAKEHAKLANKQAKEQAKLAKFQTKEIENYERSIHKKILQNILKKRKLLIRNNKL